VREVRTVIDALAPPGLAELGVAEALRIHARGRQAAATRLDVTGELSRGPAWLESALFAMAAAAIDEVAEAGRAGAVRVDLREVDGRRIISVSGDGVGQDPAPGPARGRGMGHIGIGRRAAWLGGRFGVTSEPGTGVTLRIDVPLDAGGQSQEVPAGQHGDRRP
jgi:signal transduction histidine kinase